MLHAYTRAPRENLRRSQGAKDRFTFGTKGEPGHQAVVLAHHGGFTTECVYDRTAGTFSSLPDGHLVFDVTTWESSDVVPGGAHTAAGAWRRLFERHGPRMKWKPATGRAPRAPRARLR